MIGSDAVLLLNERMGVRETKALTIDRDFFAPYQKAGDA